MHFSLKSSILTSCIIYCTKKIRIVTNILLFAIVFSFFISCEEKIHNPYEPEYAPCIYIINTDGSNLNQVTDFGAENVQFIPESQEILYLSFDYKLYKINYDGSNNILLSDTIQVYWNYGIPSVSNDGQKIAFSGSTNNRSIRNIFMVNPDGSDLKQITNITDGQAKAPNFNNDGSKIVYVITNENGINKLSIYDLNNNSNNLILSSSEIVYYVPKFNPTIDKIYYIRGPYGPQRGLYMCDYNGENEVFVSSNVDILYNIAGNGEKIVYEDNQGNVYSMNFDGSEDIYLHQGINPVISYDGELIAFHYNWVELINSDGTDFRHLYPGEKPQFSNSGNKIVFIGNYQIN